MIQWKKIRIIVAFGDITGYSQFTENIDDEKSQIIPFSKRHDALIELLKMDTGAFLRQIGDGFIMVTEIEKEYGARKALQLFKQLLNFYDDMETLISGWRYPRPDGYRIRIACGNVLRKNGQRKNDIIDYRGKAINMAHKLLNFKKHIPIIVHETAKQLISLGQAEKAGFNFVHLLDINQPIDGVNNQDISVLWSLQRKNVG